MAAIVLFATATMALRLPAQVRNRIQVDKHHYQPKHGLVPTPEVAIKIAQAVWEPIYGKGNIQRQRPFTATLEKGVWFVTGTLPRGMVGGCAIAEINKRDARIIRISHGQ